ncbi:hypothetical protein FEK30_00785 (plasmid) [Picosynechococcus sp. PCC 11901]|uniref:hypothetical protein n=1 Tax=Picosynechococcus sp. PCC 11901 TaxID=2579791 RepID=UPI0010FBCEC7|nr:hypothetical protein [Picosynechococcus sp. PCC 11901]QCS48093.1 hypothetical protein FEK30_00785 [Picosynechococcus sp. PCC 11901]
MVVSLDNGESQYCSIHERHQVGDRLSQINHQASHPSYPFIDWHRPSLFWRTKLRTPTEPNGAQNSAPTQSQTTDSQGAAPPQAAIASNNPCPIHLPNGLPTGTPATNDLVVRDIYCLSSNDDTKFADWVAFRLDRATITGSSDQDREWEADPAIAREETSNPKTFAEPTNGETMTEATLPLSKFPREELAASELSQQHYSSESQSKPWRLERIRRL